ncbi:aminotransferase class V-fold PLP-dependent enzyme (plasmid) [Aminobacter sp. SR38]|jgi:selenocysteine lyase/cysteine desulfurase|uniref:aminotransferase class V-fold PLP-dependent enzyme n=1 Tax=Aminobacter sp. SR38 TaxID=2774562 RepID=UPI001785C735|nr:aminotransferase class V-fold PLP-dependent enzyme [Aminobacter sp. SR38]QOF75473.1 aminotransferase class V-fold PLP-dependent enzyme [Aminobacter sp. SR38]
MFLNSDTAHASSLKNAPDNEEFWGAVRKTMAPMYTHTQLVNTRRGSAPLEVRERVRSLVDLSLSYELDEYEPFRDLKESGSSLMIRQMLADYFGGGADEIALTRNAMEGIATVLNGVTLKPGDEVIATKYCYDSNLAILRQRVERDGIMLKLVDLPFGRGSDAEFVKAFSDAITERTRLITFPHVVVRTGQVLPVKPLAELARAKGIFSFVDGAHSAGHICFRLDELGCDAFATCLHKWMYGPRGTGFLYVRRDKIADVWPMWASWSNKPVDSIEKFEEVGSVFKALPASIPDALAFNLQIGQEEKAARLRYMRNRWMIPLSRHEKVTMLTDIDAEPGTGFGAFVLDGIDHGQFAKALLDEFKINVLSFAMDEDPSLKGIHVSPGLSNSLEEIDRFVEATDIVLGRFGSTLTRV